MISRTIQFLKHKPSASIGFLFATGSLLLGIWVAALPGIKARLHLSDGTLGLSLLLAPVGSLLAVAASSQVYKKVTVGKALFVGHVIQCLIYGSLVCAQTKPMLWLSLFATGFIGCLNGIACNAVVDINEKQYNHKIMSTCHGMYSIGGGISAGLAALFYAAGIISYLQIAIVIFCIVTVLIFLRPQLYSMHQNIHNESGFAVPPLSVIGLAFICFVSFIGEGCIADWSAIYLKESLQASISIASLGYAGFSVMMAFGRLNGDAWVPKFGASSMVIGGSLLAAIGFALVIFLRLPYAAIAGFALVGIGFSCIVPVVISAAANIPGISPTTGIAAVTTGGLTGFLFGPAAIGFVSEHFNLATGFGLVFLLVLSAAFVASRNSFLVKDAEAGYLDIH